MSGFLFMLDCDGGCVMSPLFLNAYVDGVVQEVIAWVLRMAADLR